MLPSSIPAAHVVVQFGTDKSTPQASTSPKELYFRAYLWLSAPSSPRDVNSDNMKSDSPDPDTNIPRANFYVSSASSQARGGHPPGMNIQILTEAEPAKAPTHKTTILVFVPAIFAATVKKLRFSVRYLRPTGITTRKFQEQSPCFHGEQLVSLDLIVSAN